MKNWFARLLLSAALGVCGAAGLPGLGVCGAVGMPGVAAASVLPSGFRDDRVIADLREPTSVGFSADGRVFVAEKAGRILVFEDVDDPSPTVFADLRTQTYDANDRGLLAIALDPGFPAQPYVYALYTYDHVLGSEDPAPEWGEPGQSGDDCPMPAGTDVNDCPVSGRLVRLTANGDHAVVNGAGEAQQQVLVEDWCQQFSSHSIGDLGFDAAGALYASAGEGASFYDADYGQFGWPQKNQCGDPPTGVGSELSPPSAEGGALRSQDMRTPGDPTGLDGSLIRVDPESGEGLPGNPMFASLDQNARRIVAYGFRNPFRFAIDPDREEIYVANVGWNAFEEIDRFPITPGAAFNSGWPCYEGPGPTPGYWVIGLSLCQGLYAEPGATGEPFFVYRHGESVIPEDGCPAAFGSAVSGITVYGGGPFPSAYDNALFFADSIRGCIYVMPAGEGGEPDLLSTTTFMAEGGDYPGIDLEVGPDGALYYVKLFGDEEEGTIHRISYDADSPVARLTADPPWGDEPLEVDLDASESSDPNGDSLSFKWDLDGNGTFETSGQAQRTVTVSGPSNVEVAVKVTDSSGKSNVARVTLYPGDTPPVPEIEEPLPSMQWRVGDEIEFSGLAEDLEDGELPDSHLYWKTRLYHCPSACHAHPLRVFPGVSSADFLAPDHDYPSHIEISLTATDSRGLTATRSVAIEPRTVELAIGAEPAGVELSAGLLSQPAPFALRAIEGSTVVLSAPAEADLGGRDYSFAGWSDGGARVHSLVADDPGAYIASYEAAEPERPRAHRPQTHLIRRPARRTAERTARFVFAANQRAVRFECKLDDGAFKPCRSPRTYQHLALGRHASRIRAIGRGEVTEAEPVLFRWRVVPRRR